MQNQKAFVVLFKNEGQVYLLMTDETPHRIVGFKNLEEGLAYFEDAYNKNHDRGYEASMSACINFIQFQPKIVEFKTLDDLKAVLEADPKLLKISAVSGSYNVLKIRDDKADVWETGKSPNLISDKINPEDYRGL